MEVEQEGEVHSEFLGSIDYQIVICKGCEGVTYRSVIDGPDATEEDPLINFQTTIERCYPERLETQLPLKSIPGVPQQIKLLHREIVDGYNTGLRVLCAAGIVELLKHISSGLTAGEASVEVRLQELATRGLITTELAEALKMISFLGLRALALKNIPDQGELNDAIRLIETAMEQIYSLPGQRIRLQEKLTDKFIRE